MAHTPQHKRIGTFSNTLPFQASKFTNTAPTLKQQLDQAQEINKAVKEGGGGINANALGGMTAQEYEDALFRMTDEQFKSYNRSDKERGITTARSDPSKANREGSKASNDRQNERAAAGQRGDKAGPRGKGQYGGR